MKKIIVLTAAIIVALTVFLWPSNGMVVRGYSKVGFGVSYNPHQIAYSAPVVTDNGNKTYTVAVSNEAITIGDAVKGYFSPKIHISRFGGESWFDFIPPSWFVGDTNAVKSYDSKIQRDSVTWTLATGEGNFTFYGLTKDESKTEYGGLEFAINLYKPPTYAEIPFTINSNGLEFILQQPLTKEVPEKDWVTVTDTEVFNGKGKRIVYRPEEIVNSVVVYANGKINIQGQVNYQTGKVMHIVRPKLIDHLGNTMWGDWSLSGNIMSLILPTKWMETAAYPVLVDPTFGYTSQGGSSALLGDASGDQSTARGSLFTGAAGTGTSISAYVVDDSGGSLGFSYCLYDSSHNKVTNGPTGEGFLSSNPLTINFTSNPTLSAVDYVICANGNYDFDGGFNTAIYYDSGASNQGHYVALNYGGAWPASLSFSHNTDKYSIYVTYTAAGGIDISNTPSTKDFGTVAVSSTYYAKGSAPSNPVLDAECTYTLTNNDTSAVKINIHGHNATGGVGWTLTSSAPGSDQYRITTYQTGTNPASGVVLTTSDQQFIASLAGSSHTHWDFKFETGSAFTDGAAKTYVITLTGVTP